MSTIVAKGQGNTNQVVLVSVDEVTGVNGGDVATPGPQILYGRTEENGSGDQFSREI